MDQRIQAKMFSGLPLAVEEVRFTGTSTSGKVAPNEDYNWTLVSVLAAGSLRVRAKEI
jgi:hypothetical protein